MLISLPGIMSTHTILCVIEYIIYHFLGHLHLQYKLRVCYPLDCVSLHPTLIDCG